MKVAFIVWNPFQLVQFEAVIKGLDCSAVIVLDWGGGVRNFTASLLSSFDCSVHYLKVSEIPLIDGVYDVIVFQSPFPFIEEISLSKLVSIQYGLAKERHNYGEWRALADMNLMYGEYSARIVSHYGPSFPVGNPKFDSWFKPTEDQQFLLKRELGLDPEKRTLLFMPTWGELGSYSELLNPLAEAQAKYNVIFKIHHNNDVRFPEWFGLARSEGVKHIFDGSSDQLKLLRACDLVISDFSGAIFDGVFAQKPVLLYQAGVERKIGVQKFDLDSLEFSRRNEIGHVCERVEELDAAIEFCLKNSGSVVSKAEKLRDVLFYKSRTATSVQLCVDYIQALASGRIVPLSQPQRYVREAVKNLRRVQRIETKKRKSLYKRIYRRIKSYV